MRTALLMLRAQVSRDTLRYYERQGVIAAPPRAANGYRDYPDSTIELIRFVRLGQSVGLPLKVIRRVIPFLKAPQAQYPQFRAALEGQLASVEEQLKKLKAARKQLREWIRVSRAQAMLRTRQVLSAATERLARSGR